MTDLVLTTELDIHSHEWDLFSWNLGSPLQYKMFIASDVYHQSCDRGLNIEDVPYKIDHSHKPIIMD